MYRKNKNPFHKEKHTDAHVGLMGMVSLELERRFGLKVGKRAFEEG